MSTAADVRAYPDRPFLAVSAAIIRDGRVLVARRARAPALDIWTMPGGVVEQGETLTEALKRRCLYLWLDYPSLEHELEIVRLHAPDLPEQVAAKLVDLVAMVRDLDLKKPPSIAESIDWARALLLLGAEDIDQKVFRDTMSVIVKHRTDLDVVTERVGLKLGSPLGA